MRLLSFIATLLATVVFSLPAFSADTGWELDKEDDDIGLKIYTRAVEGSNLKEFKGEMLVETRLSSLAALLLDGKSAPKWMHNCEKFEVVEQFDPQTAVVYFINGAPWPVSDRDAVIHSTMTQDPDTLAVTADIKALPERLPLDDDYVRIPKMKGGWKFTPAEDGKINVVYQVHAEPGGGLPSWLANAVVVDTPYNTMKNMLEMLKKDDYKYASVDFILDEKDPVVEPVQVEAAPAAE